MRLLEHEAKELLKRYGITLPEGVVTATAEGVSIAYPAMVKAQVPIGGRAKNGGIIEVSDEAGLKAAIDELIGKPIRGFMATSVLAEPKAEIAHEYFMAVTYDTVAKQPLAIFSAQGGVDIEELAGEQPELVRKRHFSVGTGLPAHQAREMVAETGISGKTLLGVSTGLANLARIFLDYDCTIIEINPLVLTASGRVMALDCHCDIEDDALFRHPEHAALEKDQSRFEAESGSTEFERKAAEIDNVDHRGVAGRMIEFDGNLGLIIGGGGASLTAFDAVQQHGGQPANYCEIGGNPSVLKVKELTKHILTKPGVETVSVIMNVVSNTRVDLTARGVIAGVLESGRDPAATIAVFRVPGAWEEEGFKLLDRYGVEYCDRTVSIDQAAKIAVEKQAS